MKTFGFDLGTTYSSISYFQNGEAQTVRFDGLEQIPSLIFVDPSDESLWFGQKALEQRLDNPQQILYNTKPLLGKRIRKEVSSQNFYPSDVIYELLSFLIHKAQELAQEDIKKATFALPHFFDEKQHESIKKAAKRAGIEITEFVSEALSTAVNYFFDKKQNLYLLVVDIGGGTFEVAVVKVQNDDFELIESIGENFGGNDFDELVAEHFKGLVVEKPEHWDDEKLHQSLLHLAEQVKIQISDSRQVRIVDYSSKIKLSIDQFSSNEFEHLIRQKLDVIENNIKAILSRSDLRSIKIDKVLLSGGTCQHGVILNRIKKFQYPCLINTKVDSVSRGAAIIGHQSLSTIKKSDTLSSSIGVEVHDDKVNMRKIVHVLKRTRRFPIKGAVLCSTVPGQFCLRFVIRQGEHINEPLRNDRLGELKIDIDPSQLHEQNGVILVMQADEAGMLKCTSIEIPPSKELFSDPVFQQMLEYSDKNDGLLQYAHVYRLIQKYQFRKQELDISYQF